LFPVLSVLLILRFFARRKDFSCRFPLHFIDLVELTAESRSLKACGFAALCLCEKWVFSSLSRPRYAALLASQNLPHRIDAPVLALEVRPPARPGGLDTVITRPTWTAVVFHHDGMGEAMRLFEDHWRRGKGL
jgi:hypothetical protein